jgi:hypothetical protein
MTTNDEARRAGQVAALNCATRSREAFQAIQERDPEGRSFDFAARQTWEAVCRAWGAGALGGADVSPAALVMALTAHGAEFMGAVGASAEPMLHFTWPAVVDAHLTAGAAHLRTLAAQAEITPKHDPAEVASLRAYARRLSEPVTRLYSEDDAPADYSADDITGCAPGILRDLAYAVHAHSNTHPLLTILPGLSAAAAAIGKGSRLAIDNTRFPANSYTLTIAATGVGKSEGARPAVAASAKFAKDFRELHAREVLPGCKAKLDRLDARAKVIKAAMGEGKRNQKPTEEELEELEKEMKLIYAMRAQIEVEMIERQFIVDDITPEALVLAAAQNGEATFAFADDAGGAINIIMGRYADGQSQEAVLLKLFTPSACDIVRKSGVNIHMEAPALTLNWGFQPHLWARLAGSDALLYSGFLPRCNVADIKAGERNIQRNQPPIPAAVQARWDCLIQSLYAGVFGNADEPFIIQASEEATQALHDLRVRSESRRAKNERGLEGFWARSWEKACRLALTLHWIEHGLESPNIELSLETAEKAIAWQDWFDGEAVALFSSRSEDLQAASAADVKKLAKRQNGYITASDIVKYRIADKGAATGLLAAMVSSKILAPDPTNRSPTRHRLL